MARIMHDLEIFLKRIIHKKAYHILAGHHDFSGYPVCKIEYIINEPAFHRINASALLTVTDHLTDIVLRMFDIRIMGFHTDEVVQSPANVPENIGKRIKNWL